mgnify:CR=1 FL=1
MARALSVTEAVSMKKETLKLTGAWADAFGEPERIGVWFIWGNSGNGKSSFVMQLCKELAKFGRVAYDSLEEGASLTMQNTLRRFNMAEVNRRFQLLDCEPMSELGERMDKHKSPDFYVIDSFQYTQMTYRDYIQLKEEFPDKLFVFISHARGKNPKGDAATSVMYDADLKIWVEGYVAFSKGRYQGATGEYTIWEKGAYDYWNVTGPKQKGGQA